MIKSLFIFGIFFTVSNVLCAQAPLPAITVKNINNKIIVSWVNQYAKPIATLNIQRSYDSLKNFSTIGSVLSPQSRENGFADANPPYNKMYYRVFIAFEGGSYIITPSSRPIKDPSGIFTGIPVFVSDTANLNGRSANYSSRIFTAKDNNVVIHLEDAQNKSYAVKFYDETEKFLFELTKLKEEYLILEKVNFGHTGWFRFELFENGKLIEANIFQIVKDTKKL